MKSSRQGYTLLELSIVLTVVLLAAGILYPIGLRGMRGMALQYTAQAFAGELMRARLLALNENASVAVRITPKTQSYRLVSAADHSYSRGPERYLDRQILFSQIPSREVVFHPWGTAAPAGSYSLSGTAGQINVVVSITGRIRMVKVKL